MNNKYIDNKLQEFRFQFGHYFPLQEEKEWVEQFIKEALEQQREEIYKEFYKLKEEIYNLPEVSSIMIQGERLPLITKTMVASCINTFVPDEMYWKFKEKGIIDKFSKLKSELVCQGCRVVNPPHEDWCNQIKSEQEEYVCFCQCHLRFGNSSVQSCTHCQKPEEQPQIRKSLSMEKGRK